jgi:hypothetical protein
LVIGITQGSRIITEAKLKPAKSLISWHIKIFIISSTGALRIGQQNNGTSRFFNGYISEIIMFNCVLKNTEINCINQYLSSKYGIKL